MKTAIVTSSTRGIGRSIGIQLLQSGCRVIFNYSNSDANANELGMALEKDYAGMYKIVKADLSKRDAIDNFLNEVYGFSPKIDYLILNTAVTYKVPFGEYEFEKWDDVIRTNLTLPFFLVQKLAANINENGRIIFISSLLGEQPHAISIPYGVSKAGINMLAKYLVKEFGKNLITVNAIAPGFVETPWQNDKPLDQRNRITNKIALKRFATPDEIAKLCCSVIDNGYINGAILNIDGGYCYE